MRGAKWEELVEFAFAAGQGGLSGQNFRAVFAVFADVVEDGGFQAAETEVEQVAAGFCGAKFYWGWGAVCGSGEAIQDRAARVTQGQEFGYFVVGFACGVVAGLADFFVMERRTAESWITS